MYYTLLYGLTNTFFISTKQFIIIIFKYFDTDHWTNYYFFFVWEDFIAKD